MNGNLFVVLTVNSPEIGLYAIAQKIPACNDLISYGRDSRYVSMNVCKSWKDAQRIADDWNRAYIANGRQKKGA